MTRSRRRISASLRDLEEQEHTLYQFWNASDVLLYVGITVDWPKRLAQHAREKHWFPQVETIKTFRVPTRSQALAQEAEQIRTLKPLYNDQHNEMVEDGRPQATGANMEMAYEILSTIEDDEREALFAAVSQDDDRVYEGDELILEAARMALWNNWSCDRGMIRRVSRQLLNMQTPDFEPLARSWVLSRWEQERVEGSTPSRAEMRSGLIEAAVVKMGRDFLDRLGAEGEEWVAGARAWFDYEAPDYSVIELAVESVAGYRRKGWVRRGMCRGAGEHGARCPRKSVARVWLWRCPVCRHTDIFECQGHDWWCESHLSEAQAGRLTHEPTAEVVRVLDAVGLEEMELARAG